ncbi:amidohydrolase family protein [Natronorubrum sp. JWXQ-INN-674]|uniref:Amidohydrolase family protein n=1 Tax=Natronorubrum halalkaliphilum TaxID=2691917 RepID=A0A6B0VFH5_9EURY|nr:amidohydrolase family protein [Natronorubrum halalkaliphilum]MXV60521.1 amidohydrolase family protein [Natronorubrum halalkaliphilum]
MSENSKVIDFGAHLYPDQVIPTGLQDRFRSTDVEPRLSCPDTLLSFYDDAGIDAAVLSQPPYMSSTDAAATAEANDRLLEIVDNNDRFYGLAAIPTRAGGEIAAAEFERCLENGYHGGAIETMAGEKGYVYEDVRPVFDVAEAWNAPILVHPKLHESLHPKVLDERFYLNRTFGREVALLADLFAVIHGGVLDQHPELALVYHHLGGNVGSMMGRIRLQLDPERWPDESDAKSFDEFRTQLRERVYVDTSGFFGDETATQAAVDELGADNVVFGSDYPFEPRTPTELKTLVESAATAAGDRSREVCFENAESLLVNTSR